MAECHSLRKEADLRSGGTVQHQNKVNFISLMSYSFCKSSVAADKNITSSAWIMQTAVFA